MNNWIMLKTAAVFVIIAAILIKLCLDTSPED